jgi:hypothetical protein
MSLKVIHRLIGAIVFLTALVVFFLTVQCSVSFWDCAELSAASYGLQVTHPPGAPFFILVNRIFSMIPFAANIGFRINSLTVIASSFSVLFLYLVAVRLIQNYRGKNDGRTDSIITYVVSAIGALSMCFATAYWFNSTESNVFGFSTFLFTTMMWLMMVWWEKADEKGSEKYILLVAFILGLSPGVHLMSVLASVPLGMIFVFKKYMKDDSLAKQTGKIFIAHIILLLIIAAIMWSSQTSSTPPTPEEYRAFDNKFKIVMLVVSIIVIGIFWKKVFNRSSFYAPMIAGLIAMGIVYPGIVKVFPNFIVMIGADNLFTDSFIVIIILAIIAYIAYWAYKNKRPIVNLVSLALLLAVIGFTTYAFIMIRANKHPAMNENDPQDFKTLVSYLSREQYGDFPTFKRRFSAEPQHQPTWANYSSDLDYFWRWQMNHMYIRYLLWEYVGRQSWDQDAGVKFSQLYGIPFLIGLLGLFYHFRRDWRMASIFLTTFIVMGFLICFYQNQQQAQPRDREYFYSGSWFVFSIWIALGLRGIIEDFQAYIRKPSAYRVITYSVIGIAFLFIPVNMLRTNYFTEDRSKNWVPWDYAYNMLQSCAPNAILFTCGDNDTFPLWYMQDVEGVRRDVRIANLSLINTDWYIKELKNDTPYGAMKVPMSYTNDQIERLQPVQWESKNVDIPVPKSVFEQFGVKDTSLIKRGKISFIMQSTVTYGNIKAIRVQDLMIKDIVLANKWERPIYFAISCGEDSRIGLDDFMKLEGLAYRLVPEKTPSVENVNVKIASENLMGQNVKPSKTYQAGFIIRSLDNPGVFLDENMQRTTYGYRNAYMALANYYLSVSDEKQKCIDVLNVMNQRIPLSHVELDYRLMFNLATLYYNAGDIEQFRSVAQQVETIALQKIAENPRNINSYYNPYVILKVLYEYSREYDKELDILRKMTAVAGNAPELQAEIQRITRLKDSLLVK